MQLGEERTRFNPYRQLGNEGINVPQQTQDKY
jgi:hypothetical protein